MNTTATVRPLGSFTLVEFKCGCSAVTSTSASWLADDLISAEPCSAHSTTQQQQQQQEAA
jgi:hypothetical protein